MNDKAIVLSSLILLLSVSVSAVPELSVSPGEINWTGNESIKANQDYTQEFQVVNQNSSKKIYDVTLSNTKFLTWNNSVNGSLKFDLNASESRTVSATIHTNSPGRVNRTLEVPYRYNNSGDITKNENFYPSIEFYLESSWRQTNISTRIFDQKYNLSLGESEISVFQVKNVGNETAYYVEPSGKYMSFNPGVFNVSEGSDQYVDFTLKIPEPDDPAKATNMTNRTYHTSINVSGDNFQEKKIPINITVPYKKYEPKIKKNGSISKLLEDFKQYCQTNPGACNITETVYKNRTVVKNQTPVYEANLTEEQLKALVNLSEEELSQDKAVRGEVQLNRQLIKTMIERFNATLQERTGKALNKSERALKESKQTQKLVRQELQQENTNERQASRLGTWIFIIAVVFAILLAIGYFAYKTHQKSKDYRLIQ